jgi:hypothetical protein
MTIASVFWRDAMAWATFIVVALCVLEATSRALTRVRLFFTRIENQTPSVEADVRALIVDARNPNADPTAPPERMAAVTEYQQHRRR